jgi:hypothetical protein
VPAHYLVLHLHSDGRTHKHCHMHTSHLSAAACATRFADAQPLLHLHGRAILIDTLQH